MWENYEIWFHPLSGIVLLVGVILLRKDLRAPALSRRLRTLRWSQGGLLVAFFSLQAASILRSVFDTRDFTHLPYTIFGISDIVVAFFLYIGFLRGWFARDAGNPATPSLSGP